MPDFRFITGNPEKNGFDFVFTAEKQLILRTPDGICFQVDIQGNDFDELKEYIGAIRINRFPITPWITEHEE